MSSTTASETCIFNAERHVKYWLRCLKTYLPTGYTSNDSNRMMIACFILSALDLLGALQERTTFTERQDFVNWIYHCQHPDGGFRAFTGTDVGSLRNSKNEHWDPANLAGTYFALAALVVLEDDLERVERKKCLEWLAKLQHKDGSLGEFLGQGGSIEGGRDLRYCLLAAQVRWIIRADLDDEAKAASYFDVDKLTDFVKSSQTYDGGMAKAPYHEAHAGWNYCGIGTLSLLGKLPATRNGLQNPEGRSTVSQKFMQDSIHWLASRQTSTIVEDEDGYQITEDPSSPSEGYPQPDQSFRVLGASIVLSIPATQDQSLQPLEVSAEELQCAGFNGRCNKVADTCYSFWVGGALGILHKVHLLDFNANRRYLLEKTQHLVGGFGKLPGDPPDIMHSYLGLAALAIMKEPGLKSLDPTLCISLSAREHLESLPWRKGGGREEEEEGAREGYTMKEFREEAHSHMSVTGG